MKFTKVIFAILLIGLTFMWQQQASGEQTIGLDQREVNTPVLNAQLSGLPLGLISSLFPTITSSIGMIGSISMIMSGVNDAFEGIEAVVEELGGTSGLGEQLQALALANFDFAGLETQLTEATASLERAFEALNNISEVGPKAAVEAAEEAILGVEGIFEAASTLVGSADEEIERLDRILTELMAVLPISAETFTELENIIETTNGIVDTADEMVEATLQLVKVIKIGLKVLL